MPKRTREEKLAAYSKGAKRGYRARKRFVAMNGVEMKSPQPGRVEGLTIGNPGGIAAGRAVGTAGPNDAIQLTKEQDNYGLYINENESQGANR
jgi:hypothetical protein